MAHRDGIIPGELQYMHMETTKAKQWNTKITTTTRNTVSLSIAVVINNGSVENLVSMRDFHQTCLKDVGILYENTIQH